MNVAIKTLAVCAWAAVTAAFADGEVATPFPEGKKAALAFTFDDGTLDQYEVAAPVLDQYGIKAIFNIVPSRIGTDDAKYMTWDQVRDLVRRGHELGNHTYSHPNLLKLLSQGQTNAVIEEIRKGHDEIKKHTGYEAKVVCYPGNAMNGATERMVREMGFSNSAYRLDNWGGKFAAEQAHQVAEKAIQDGAWRFALLHGLRPGGGWAPLNRPEQFEEIVKALLEHDELWVAGYSETIVWREGYKRYQARRRWEAEQLARYARTAIKCDVKTPGGWSAVRACGENVAFEVSFRPAGTNIAHRVQGLKAKIRLDDSGTKILAEKEVDFATNIVAAIEGTLGEPGSLRVVVEVPGLHSDTVLPWQKSIEFKREK